MNIGRIGIMARGAYQLDLSYETLDFVTHNESSYIAKENILIGEVPGVSSKWQLACKKGNPGDKGLDAYGHWLALGNTGSVEQFVASFSNLKKIATLGVDFATSVVAVSQVPDFTLPIKAGKRYKLKGLLHAQTVVTTTGIRVQLGLVSGGATSFGYMEGQLSNLGVATGLRIGIITMDTVVANNPQLATTTSGAANPIVVEINVVVQCVEDSEIGIWFGSEIASSQAMLKAGSYIEIEEF